MPVLIYEEPKLNLNQRKELIKALTEAACNVDPEIPKEAHYVFLKEHPDDKIDVGGCTRAHWKSLNSLMSSRLK